MARLASRIASDHSAAGIHEEVIEIVELLTRRESPHADGDSEGDETAKRAYYEAIRANPAARAVKVSDIRHNTHPDRVRHLDDETRTRLRNKYESALGVLGESWPWPEG